MGYRGKRRKRRCRTVPVLLSGAIVLGAFAVLRWCSPHLTPKPVPVMGQNAPVQSQWEESSQSQSEESFQNQPSDGLPLHHVTPSGIAVTLTLLDSSAVYEGEQILVNNHTLYRFMKEQSLVSILEVKNKDYLVRDNTVLLHPTAAHALNDMLAAFRSQGGSKTINVVAGHRTKEFQQHLFDQSAEKNGIDHANRYVAQPGGSEHHTGYAVDFSVFLSDGSSMDYDGTGEYSWLNDNCHHYGYIVRYDNDKEAITGIADEPWHFRYVGVPHATAMTERGECFEEYWNYLHTLSFDGEHLTISCASGEYEVWYTYGTTVYLPDTADYTISGDNVGGILVTVKIS